MKRYFYVVPKEGWISLKLAIIIIIHRSKFQQKMTGTRIMSANEKRSHDFFNGLLVHVQQVRVLLARGKKDHVVVGGCLKLCVCGGAG